MSEIPLPHIPPGVKGIGSHYKIIAFAMIAVVVVFVLLKARSSSGVVSATPVNNPVLSVGSGSSQTPDNSGTPSPGTDANSTAIQSLSDTLDLQFNQASRLQALSNTGASSAETLREQGVTFNEGTRETGSAFDTQNALTTGLNAVKVTTAQDAETLQAQSNQFNWLYGNSDTTPNAGSFLSSYALGANGSRTPPVGQGNTRADTLYTYGQAPIVAQFGRDQQALDAATQRGIQTTNAATVNQIQNTVATNQAQIALNNSTNANGILTSNNNVLNSIKLNDATTQNQLSVIKQQGDTSAHLANVNSRNSLTNSIVGTVGKLLGGIF